jgi:hypothetical protein
MVPAPGERSELGGGRQSIGKFRSTEMGGWPTSRISF